ncbi:MAG: hypothetical protein AAFZ07_02460 [Actinomycetota bacterium]
MSGPPLRSAIVLVMIGAVIAAVREAMLRHHERGLGARDRHEP